MLICIGKAIEKEQKSDIVCDNKTPFNPNIIGAIIIAGMKNITLCENEVTIKSRLNDSSREQMEKLATEILN